MCKAVRVSEGKFTQSVIKTMPVSSLQKEITPVLLTFIYMSLEIHDTRTLFISDWSNRHKWILFPSTF